MSQPKSRVPKQLAEDAINQNARYAKRKALLAANELARRQIEALKLYQPQALQQEFHECDTSECMVQGGNRAGKSLAAFVEDARAVLGQDPYDKYPKRDGILAIVGYKEWHIGNVVYPYLFKAGAFKIIRDEETELWRVYRPWVPQDKAREKEAKPSPPLIPPRMVDKIVWKDRGKQVFTNVYLKTGWEIKAFSSSARPEQGYQADLFHIDEDVLNPMWYEEAKGRLIDRNGRLIWSALPHDDNDAIARFVERADQQEEDFEAGGPKPMSVVLKVSMESNPYLPEEAKAAAIAGWKSMGEDVYRKRALGELVTDSVLVYPMWRRSVHDAATYSGRFQGEIDAYFKSTRKRDGIDRRHPPLDWCLRLAVDPGHDTAAAVMIATPPSGRFHLVFDEIYLRACTSKLIARALLSVTKNVWYQSFLIDAHGGNLTSIDTGISPREAYEREMDLLNVACVETGAKFKPGCDKISYREEVIRSMLSVDGTGAAKIIVDFDQCPNLDREMRRFRKKRVNGQIVDTGNRRSNTHAIETLEYLGTYLNDLEEPYIKPRGNRKAETPGQRRVREYHRRKSERQQAANPFGVTSTIILGPQGVY